MRRWIKIAVPLGIAAVLVSVLAIGFGSPSGLAAPGGNGNGHGYGRDGDNGKMTISIAEGNPHFGTTITFAVDGKEPNGGRLFVANACYQGGELVGGQSLWVEDGMAGPFTLGPSTLWTGGAADCEAQVWVADRTLKRINGATVSYHVEA